MSEALRALEIHLEEEASDDSLFPIEIENIPDNDIPRKDPTLTSC
jgi:hypothetical protein